MQGRGELKRLFIKISTKFQYCPGVTTGQVK